jgi:hypothetical protein
MMSEHIETAEVALGIQDASRGRCAAALMLAGEHFQCDLAAEHDDSRVAAARPRVGDGIGEHQQPVGIGERTDTSDRVPLTRRRRSDFEQRRQLFVKEQVEPTLTFVRSIDARVVGTRTGDIFELARRSKERMWRVEAVMALGRVRYFVGTSDALARVLRLFAPPAPAR